MHEHTFDLVIADPADPVHASALVDLLNQYALDVAGGGHELPPEVKNNLAGALAKRAYTHILIAYDQGTPAGMVIAFEGFSTFACKPLLNIHDVIVAKPYRGRGLADRMLLRLEEIARARGCCKLTLEVLEGNIAAQMVYSRVGFQAYQLDPGMGRALFWEKKL